MMVTCNHLSTPTFYVAHCQLKHEVRGYLSPYCGLCSLIQIPVHAVLCPTNVYIVKIWPLYISFKLTLRPVYLALAVTVVWCRQERSVWFSHRWHHRTVTVPDLEFRLLLLCVQQNRVSSRTVNIHSYLNSGVTDRKMNNYGKNLHGASW
jgi:hypothetical protein